MSALDVTAAPATGLKNIGASHTRRVRVLVVFASTVSITIGVPWATFFALRGDWLIVASECLIVLAGVAAVGMTRSNRLRSAAILLTASLFLRITAFAFLLDIPNAGIPRCIHHYLIPLGLGAYLMLKHENPWLRDSLACGCMAFVVFFTASDFGFATSHAIPDSIRAPGNWINNASAMVVMFFLLHIFVADIDRLEARLHRVRQGWIDLVH